MKDFLDWCKFVLGFLLIIGFFVGIFLLKLKWFHALHPDASWWMMFFHG